jgi:hypothetical protein
MRATRGLPTRPLGTNGLRLGATSSTEDSTIRPEALAFSNAADALCPVSDPWPIQYD